MLYLDCARGISPESARVNRKTDNCQSPRWLILKDRHEEALESLRKFRVGKFSDEEIDIEFRGMVDSIQKNKQSGTFFDIFRRQHFRRTIVVVGANFFLQGTGQQFTSIYGAPFVKSLGTVNPFTITVVIAAVNVVTAVAAQIMLDRIGRR
jgi:MFS transporter, SP family, sugar:H+ symporter